MITRMLESLKTLCLLADGEESFSTSYSDVEVGNTATAFAYFEVGILNIFSVDHM